MNYRENEADSISRLEQMAEPDSKWDLSENDQSAIRFALDKIKGAVGTAPLREALAKEIGEILVEMMVHQGLGERDEESNFDNCPEDVREFLREQADRILALLPRSAPTLKGAPADDKA